MSLTTTNFRTLVNSILPPQLRSVSMLDWLQSLLSGLQTRMTSIDSKFGLIPTKFLFTGQKMVLQAALNLLMSPVVVQVNMNYSFIYRTYIWNEAEAVFIYIYNQLESSSLGLFLWNESELLGTDLFDFNISIYFEDATPEVINQITGYANQFKLAGKTFNVTDDL